MYYQVFLYKDDTISIYMYNTCICTIHVHVHVWYIYIYHTCTCIVHIHVPYMYMLGVLLYCKSFKLKQKLKSPRVLFYPLSVPTFIYIHILAIRTFKYITLWTHVKRTILRFARTFNSNIMILSGSVLLLFWHIL